MVLSERIPAGTGSCSSGGNPCAYYYLYDGLGSVVGLTDSTGAVVNRYSYDPYGKTLSATEGVSNPYRYIGAIWDASTGLYKMGERYYDPSVGRFTQTDPLGGGYSYGNGDPINYSDPSGLAPCRNRRDCVLKAEAFLAYAGYYIDYRTQSSLGPHLPKAWNKLAQWAQKKELGWDIDIDKAKAKNGSRERPNDEGTCGGMSSAHKAGFDKNPGDPFYTYLPGFTQKKKMEVWPGSSYAWGAKERCGTHG